MCIFRDLYPSAVFSTMKIKKKDILMSKWNFGDKRIAFLYLFTRKLVSNQQWSNATQIILELIELITLCM